MTLTGTTSIRHRSQRLLRLTPKAAHRLAELKVLSPKIKHHSHGFKNQPPWPSLLTKPASLEALLIRSSRLCNKLRDQPTHYQNREPAPQPLRPKHRPGRRRRPPMLGSLHP